MKIKPKLFVIILTLVLLSLLITSAFSINAFSQAMISDIKKRLEDNAVISMQQISFITSQKVSDAKMFSSLIGRLLESNQSAIFDENTLEQILGDVLAREANSTSPTFNSIAIYNKSGAKIAHKIIRANDNTDNLKSTLPNNSINEEFFETAIQGQSFHDNVPWHSSFLNESIIRVSAPIPDRENSNDKVYSVLALTYSLNEIFEQITSINPDASSRNDRDDNVEKNIGIYLLSQNGTRIYYSNFFDTSREPNGTRNSYTPSIFKQIKDSDNGIVSGIYPANIVDNPFGDERDAIFVATKGKIGNNNNDKNTVASANNIANSNNNVEYDNMKENNWFLITSLGTESAFAEISNLRNIFILVTLVVLAGTAIAVFYISRIISKPIMKLKDAAISIAHGNLNIPFKPVPSKDEIGELATNFEKMRHSIKKYTDALTGKEKELQQINDELIANDRAKEEFISMVSHELRTPLVPIKLYSEMLLRPGIIGVLNKKQKKAVETINKNMLKQEQLVEDILDVFKLDMGTLHLAKQEIEIFNLVKDIVTDLKTFTIEKQIEITYEISTQSMKTIFCDRRRIEQVFVNLIKNSIDFVPDKTGKIKVKAQEVLQDVPSNSTADNETKSTLDSRTVVFSVEDNGIGIPNQNANNLFKKFYQIDTSVTRKHGGTGLGLAICKGIVEAHDGKIWIDKNYTAGTAIRFTIPSKQ